MRLLCWFYEVNKKGHKSGDEVATREDTSNLRTELQKSLVVSHVFLDLAGMEAAAEDVDLEVVVSSGNSTTSKAGSAEVPNYWAVLLLLVSTRVILHPIHVPFIRNSAILRSSPSVLSGLLFSNI